MGNKTCKNAKTPREGEFLLSFLSLITDESGYWKKIDSAWTRPLDETVIIPVIRSDGMSGSRHV